MHVALIAGHAPSLVRFRGPLIRAMLDAGHRVTALAPEDAATATALQAMGAGFEPILLERRSTRPADDLRTRRALTDRLRSLGPDAVLCYTIKPVIWGSPAARRAGVQNVCSLVTGLGRALAPPRGAGLWPWVRQSLVRRVVIRLYRRALGQNRLVFFQNPDDEVLFRRLRILGPGQGSIVVPGSGVDLEEFAACGPPPSPPVFLCLARLIEDKGVYEYAEAARRIRAVLPQVRFLLAGPEETGPGAVGAQELKPRAGEPGVEYLGEVEDVRPLLAACTAFVLPSFYGEGVPRSSLEALASARAVVSTDHPGCREAVRHGETGLLVPPRDADALEAALMRLVQDPQEAARMGRAGRALAEERFDVHLVNRMILTGMGLVGGPEDDPGGGA